jgi:hypothetical protein
MVSRLTEFPTHSFSFAVVTVKYRYLAAAK